MDVDTSRRSPRASRRGATVFLELGDRLEDNEEPSPLRFVRAVAIAGAMVLYVVKR